MRSGGDGADHRRMSQLSTSTDTRTPLDTVVALYAAFGRGDMPALFSLLDDDVDWSLDVPAEGGQLVPMFRHGRGHDAVRGYFSGVAQLEFHVFEPVALHADGDVVLAELRLDVTHRSTGRRAAFEEIHHWVVRDGVVVRFRPFVDTATMIEIYRG